MTAELIQEVAMPPVIAAAIETIVPVDVGTTANFAIPEEEEVNEKKVPLSQLPFDELIGTLGWPTAMHVSAGQGESSLTKNHAFYTREQLGGKGFGLVTLRGYESAGFKVPPFWIIRTPWSEKGGEPFLKSIPTQMRYAVRSGAPKSMPGMMATVLNVPHCDLREAVQKVWDSYHESHAVAYRDANNIPHTIGTAVVIQGMIEPRISGVAFTRNPQMPHKKGAVDISIGYVEGYGDKLVGGVSDQLEMNKEHPDYARLSAVLRAVDEGEGASDIEWVIGVDKQIYLVQLRPLKFIDLDAVNVKDAPEQADKVIVGGNSIGHINKVAGVLTTDLKNRDPQRILYVQEFTPEVTESMIGAAALVAKIGGFHCHAGIIAREQGIPAITGVHPNDLANYTDGTRILVDGKTGCLYTIKTDAEVINDAPKVLEHLIPTEERTPRLELRKRKKSLEGNILASRFYHTLAVDGLADEERNRRVIEIAHTMGTYMWVTCLGECRHAGIYADSKPEGKAAYEKMLKMGIKLNGGMERGAMIASVPEMGYEDAAEAIRLAEVVFTKLKWPNSFGGKKWGRIAQVCHEYITGKLNERLFLDSCFNLKHNGGTIFGKLSWCNLSGNIQELLDQRQKLSKDSFEDYLRSAGLFGGANDSKPLLTLEELAVPKIKPLELSETPAIVLSDKDEDGVEEDEDNEEEEETEPEPELEEEDPQEDDE